MKHSHKKPARWIVASPSGSPVLLARCVATKRCRAVKEFPAAPTETEFNGRRYRQKEMTMSERNRR